MRLPLNEYAIETPIVLLILILVAVPLIFFGVRYEMKVRAETQAQAKRETTYQAALRSYQQTLKPGMNRKEVEEYLRLKNISFRQMCCVEDHSKKSWDDLTKIGEEKAPWFCGDNNVYIAFQFTDHPEEKETWWRANDLDGLRSVTIFHWSENCL
jgi:hypothetical protein